MNIRAREFAMLKSVGMTKKEFARMVRLESIMCGGKSLIIGIPIGIVLSLFFHMAAGTQLELPYEVPVIPILVTIIAVFIVVGFTMKYSMSRINKQNIIETIRRQNY
jgi:putative ABC transport system permease protein